MRFRGTAETAFVLCVFWRCTAWSGTPVGVKHTLRDINGDAEFSIEFPLPATGPNLGSLPEGDGGAGPSSITLGAWSHGSPDTTNVCAVLGSDTVATLNGTVLSPVSLGWFGGDACQVAQWTVADPNVFSQPTLTVRLADSTGTLLATFVNVDSPRAVAVVSPASAIVHVGDLVAVKLLPGTDVFPPRRSTLAFERRRSASPKRGHVADGRRGTPWPRRCAVEHLA